MFCNWGAVLKPVFVGVSSSADTTGGGTWISPWLGHEKWLKCLMRKKILCCSWNNNRTLQWIQSSFTRTFFLNSTTISWSLRQGNCPHFKEGGNWDTWGWSACLTLESQGWKGCWGASLHERHSWVCSVFSLFFSSLPLNPLPSFFRSEIYSHLKISYSIVLNECIFGVCWMNVRWVSMKSYVDHSS